jgi:hypothetical protein
MTAQERYERIQRILRDETTSDEEALRKLEQMSQDEPAPENRPPADPPRSMRE